MLLHTLVYRTEQAFLIHRTTGLPLLHVAAPEVRNEAQDADMVSGMLTAIRDFVQDAFRNNSNEGGGTNSLDALRVGELEVWVEQGPLAVIACVIRGSAPKELHTLFQETLEHIHGRYGRALERFDGDTAPFAPAQPELEQCLKSGYRREQTRKLSPALAVVLILLGVARYVVGGLERSRGAALARVRDQAATGARAARRRGAHRLVDALDRRAPGSVGARPEGPARGGRRRCVARQQPLGTLPGRSAGVRAATRDDGPAAAAGGRADLRRRRAARPGTGRRRVGQSGADGVEADSWRLGVRARFAARRRSWPGSGRRSRIAACISSRTR